MSNCAILIDTDVALRFLPIDQIDWPGINGAQPVSRKLSLPFNEVPVEDSDD